jgi:hypothetical protein
MSKLQDGHRMSSPRLFVVAVGELVLKVGKAPMEIGRTAADDFQDHLVGPALQSKGLYLVGLGRWFGHP